MLKVKLMCVMLPKHYLQFWLCGKMVRVQKGALFTAPKVHPISFENPSSVKGQVTLVTVWSPWRPLSPGTSRQSSEWETIQFKHSCSFWKRGIGGIMTYCVNKRELSLRGNIISQTSPSLVLFHPICSRFPYSWCMWVDSWQMFLYLYSCNKQL